MISWLEALGLKPAPAPERKLTGEILVEIGVITEEQLQRALEEQRRFPAKPFGAILSDLGFADMEAVARALDKQRISSGRLLGERLLKKGVLSREQLDQALEDQRRNPAKRLGAILVDRGYATEQQIQEAAVYYVPREALWSIIAACAVLVIGAVVILSVDWGGQDAATAGADPGGGAPAEGPPAGMFNPRPTPEQRAENYIDQYKREIAEGLDADKTALNLRRIGNLYFGELQNYAEAAKHYEEVLARFPDWEGNKDVYINLAACYERLGNRDLEKWTYERILQRFPEDSQEHLFARQKLGL